jgi:hypothetical protein
MADNTAQNGTSTIATEDVGGVHYQKFIPSPEAHAAFRGRAATFRTPGRAGTSARRLLTLHNATGSPVLVHVNQLTIDLYQTVIKAVTVAPPIIRVNRITALPSGGTALSKVAKDSALTSDSHVVVTGDASADGTVSASALTATPSAGTLLTQEYAPRLITAAGYEMFDRTELLSGWDVILRALEGIVLSIDYAAATQEPSTDMWIATVDWYEVA